MMTNLYVLSKDTL